MSKLNTLLEKAQKHTAYCRAKAKEAEQFESLLVGLVADLPPGLPYTGASEHGYKAEALLTLEVEEYGQARELLQALPPVPAVKRTDGCTSFIPADAKPDREGERGEKFPIFPAWVRCQNVVGPDIEVNWYTDVGGRRVQVKCKVKRAWDWCSWHGRKCVAQGTVYMRDRKFTHHFAGCHRVQWWVPEDSYMQVALYWDESASPDLVFSRLEHPACVIDR